MADGNRPPVEIVEQVSFWTPWELRGSFALAEGLEAYHAWMWPGEQIDVERGEVRDV